VFNPLNTNTAGLMETNFEGRFVMLTNVFFTTGGGVYPSGVDIVVTNQNGVPFNVFISGQCTNVVGMPTPSFGWSLVGALDQSKGGTYSAAGYEIALTSPDDVIVAAPSSVTATVGINGVLTWTAVPYNYSYSILAAAELPGPYVPLVTGLTFNNTFGNYTDTGAYTYVAALYSTNEVPALNTPAVGYGFVVLSSDSSTITCNLHFTGLAAPASAAHIHGPAPAGMNTGVLFPFSGVPTATSGIMQQQSFAITAVQVGYLQTGQLYMNVHDSVYPNGEIRGQLFPATTKFYKVATP
jgi:hypothetical protein